MIVYIYTFPNGKKYVGQTVQTLNQRAAKGQGYRHSPFIYNAIQKYGRKNIKKEIYKCQSEEEMDEIERALIKKYNTTNRDYDYNIEDGGNKNKHVSENTKTKISQALKNHPVSDKTKEKLSKAHTGKSLTEDQKRKISAGNKGKTISEEAKNKISIANGKPVICLETKKIYLSVGLAAKDVNLKSGKNIIAVCTGYREKSGGYHWMYLEDYEKLNGEKECKKY